MVGKAAVNRLLGASLPGFGSMLTLGSFPCAAADSFSQPQRGRVQTEHPSAPPPPSSDDKGEEDDFWSRPTMTGDWFGLRSKIKDAGVRFSAMSTHFGFGIVGRINQPVPAPLGQDNAFDYTGRSEYGLTFDLDKLVGLPHGRLLVRAEHWYGEYDNVSLRTGTFPPAVFPPVLPPTPNDPGIPYLPSFFSGSRSAVSWSHRTFNTSRQTPTESLTTAFFMGCEPICGFRMQPCYRRYPGVMAGNRPGQLQEPPRRNGQ